jgi:hypothetical protein
MARRWRSVVAKVVVVVIVVVAAEREARVFIRAVIGMSELGFVCLEVMVVSVPKA